MLRWLLRIGLAIVVIGGGFAGYMYNEVRTLEVVPVTDDLWMISGVGSNVAVLRTSEGAVIVDSMTFPLQGRLIEEQAKALTGQPVALLINTHYHLDHTHGNPGFDDSRRLRVVATDRTLAHLKRLDGAFWEGDAAQFLPNETFTDAREISIGGKTLRLRRPGRGHTDGDLVVLFVEDQTIHMGDLYFNKHYPNIDLEAGGSVKEWSASIDASIAGATFTKVIPGHGALSDKAGLDGFQRFIEELDAVGAKAAADGASLEQTLERTDLTTDAGFTEIHFGPIPLGLDRDFVIRRAWEEATGAIKTTGAE